MTTRVEIKRPEPNHKNVKVEIQDNVGSDGMYTWKTTSEEILSADAPDAKAPLYIHGSRRIVISEVD